MFNINNNSRGFNQQQGGNGGNNNFQPNRRVQQNSGPTPKQVKLYLDLCGQKSVEPNPAHTQFSVKQMSEEITRLMSMASPGYNNSNQQGNASFQGFEQVSQPVKQQSYQDGPENVKATDRQISTMIQIGEELGLKANEQVLKSMSMAQASAQIDKMIGMRKTKVDAGPSERQLQMLQDMHNCPDIDYEAFYRLFPIKDSVLLEKSRLQNQLKVVLRDESDNNGKERRVISDKIVELDNFIKNIVNVTDWNELSRRDVSNFIQDNQQSFYAWKDNQATPAQINLIMDLQDRLHTFSNNWNLNLDGLASDIEGNQIDNRNDLLSDFNESIDYKLEGDDFLFATKDFARNYITQLQKELTRLSNLSSETTEREYDEKRNVLTELEANEKYEQNVIDMIYGLYAMLGQSAEDSTIEATNVDEKLKELIEMNILYANQVDPIKDFVTIRDYVDEFVDGVELFNKLEITPAI